MPFFLSALRGEARNQTGPMAAQGLPEGQSRCHSLCTHRTLPQLSIDVSELPPSYQTNSPSEELLLQVADNYSRQYSHLCPDRVPLFLHPLNECQVPVRPALGGFWGAEGNWGAELTAQGRIILFGSLQGVCRD